MEEKMPKKINVVWLLTIFISAVYLLMRAFLEPKLYGNVDSYYISIVTGGLFSDDNYCIFINPILCDIIKIINVILPSADGFTLFCFISEWVGFSWGSYVTFKSAESRHQKIILLLGWLVIMSFCTPYTNFTLTAGFLGFSGSVSIGLLFKAKNKINKLLYSVLGTLLILSGCLIRMEAVMIFLPFWLLLFLTECISERKNLTAVFKRGGVFLPILICIIVSWIYQYAVYHSEKYVDGLEYNFARASLVDYSVKDYEEIKEELPDVTKNDYYMATNLMLGDTDRINTEFLKKISNVSVKYFDNLSAEMVAGAFAYLYDAAIYGIYASLITVVLLIWVYILFLDAPPIIKAETLAAFLGMVAISLYFLLKGRFVMHIFFVFVLANLFILICILCDNYKIKTNFAKIGKGIVYITIFILLFSLGKVCYNAKKNFTPFAFLTAKDNVNDTMYYRTYIGDDLYIWNVWDYDYALADFVGEDKLPSKLFLEHNIPFGEWTYGQPYFKDHLKKINAENPMYALLYRDNTYYVSNDYEKVLCYIKEHIDPNATIEEREKGIYKFIP